MAARSAGVAPRATLRTSVDPILAASLWGGMYVVSRATFGAVPPVTLGALRVVLGGAALAVALRVLGAGAPRWQRGDARRAVWLGAIVAACILTQFLGTALASAHDGALLTTSTPIFVVPLAWAVLGERPRWPVVAGTLLALLGVGIVVAAQTSASGGGSAPLLGDALLLVSALAWALFTVLGAPLVRRYSALPVATAATLWSALFLLPLVPLEWAVRGSIPALPSPGALAAVLYLGLGATALAWLLWYRGVARLEAGVVAVFFFAQPLVGGVAGALLLGEQLSTGFWLGGAVLALGTLVVAWAPAART